MVMPSRPLPRKADCSQVVGVLVQSRSWRERKLGQSMFVVMSAAREKAERQSRRLRARGSFRIRKVYKERGNVSNYRGRCTAGCPCHVRSAGGKRRQNMGEPPMPLILLLGAELFGDFGFELVELGELGFFAGD